MRARSPLAGQRAERRLAPRRPPSSRRYPAGIPAAASATTSDRFPRGAAALHGRRRGDSSRRLRYRRGDALGVPRCANLHEEAVAFANLAFTGCAAQAPEAKQGSRACEQRVQLESATATLPRVGNSFVGKLERRARVSPTELRLCATLGTKLPALPILATAG